MSVQAVVRQTPASLGTLPIYLLFLQLFSFPFLLFFSTPKFKPVLVILCVIMWSHLQDKELQIDLRLDKINASISIIHYPHSLFLNVFVDILSILAYHSVNKSLALYYDGPH